MKLRFDPLRRIPTPGGEVMHALKATDQSFAGFGEAYFSTVDFRAIKGWKAHRKMTMNVVVPYGKIQISVCDDAAVQHFVLGPDRSDTYGRLTIPAGLWVAFGGMGLGTNILLNIASIPHDPLEAVTKPLEAFPWTWVEGE